MNELIIEIENDDDFHTKPAIGDVPSPKSEFKDAHLNGGNVKYCQNCGAQATADDRFCTSCGFKFEEEMKCPNCGIEVNADDMFCTNCGNKL